MPPVCIQCVWRRSTRRDGRTTRWSIRDRRDDQSCTRCDCRCAMCRSPRGLSGFAGRTRCPNAEVVCFGLRAQLPHQSIGPALLPRYVWIYLDPSATDLYTRHCALNVSARDLAVMGATLADGGHDPLTQTAGSRCRQLSLRVGGNGDCRLYETSGDSATTRVAGTSRHRRMDWASPFSGQCRIGDLRSTLDQAGNIWKCPLFARFLLLTSE